METILDIRNYEETDINNKQNNKYPRVNPRTDISVEEEIAKGVKLRHAKPNFPVPNTLHIKAVKRNQIFGAVRNKPRTTFNPQLNLSQTTPCTPRSCSPPGRPISSSQMYSPMMKNYFSRPTTPTVVCKVKKIKRCPLRIAELAEPKKRHCLETWKSKHNTLPSYMLDRLRKNIMNQKIIANVPDAITCFQIKPNRPSSRKRDKGQAGKRKNSQKETQEVMYLRNMCAVFAHCMAKKLIRPLNIDLTGNLEKVSNIIALEMIKLFENRSKFSPDYLQDSSILKEMAGKVTIWIAGILDDVYCKELEEDLKAKKRQENQLGKEGKLVTLIEKYILMQFEDRGELEEEEGPALEALDSLIDNVMKLCIPKSDSDDEYESPDENMSQAEETEQVESLYDTGGSTDRQDVDSPDSTIQQTSDQHSELTNDDLGSNENVNNQSLLASKTDLLDLPVYDQRNSGSISVKSDQDSNSNTTEAENAESDIKDILNALLNEEQFNVSDVLALKAEDHERKSVKFSDLDLGSEAEQSGELTKPKTVARVPSSTGGLTDILLAPPNDHLLSLADELWPNDFTSPALKPTASVSKSVTSLGKIIEGSEYYSGETNSRLSNDYSNNFEYDDHIQTKEENEINAILNTYHLSDDSSENVEDIAKRDKQFRKYDDVIKEESPESSSTFKSDMTRKYLNTNNEQVDKNEDVAKNEKEKDRQNYRSDTDSEGNPIIEAIKQKMKLPYNTQPKFDYKVNPQTAPSWATNTPSDESMVKVSKNKRKNISQCELRKWCKDLEHTLVNLEQWNQWIDVSCKKIMMMKQQTEVSNIFAPTDDKVELKAWFRLKTSIDKEAVLWRKLSQRIISVLNRYDTGANLTTAVENKAFIGDGKRQEQTYCDVKTIFDNIDVFDCQSVWLHRLIVSTEYLVCNCESTVKNNPQRKMIKTSACNAMRR